MNRIIDVNLNRTTEALRVIEEIARFELNDADLSQRLKLLRHRICGIFEQKYGTLLCSRDTENDIGIDITNPTEKKTIENVFKANIKRLQQSLRTLSEYCGVLDLDCSIFENARYESYSLEKKIWEKLLMKMNKFKLNNKKLYLVTNSDKFGSDDDFLDAVAAALSGGVQIVQLREKNRSAKEIIDLAKKIRNLCSMFDALFIVNDRIDIAQIAGADGVHLGQDDVDISYAREILGMNSIIGVSTHAPAQALEAVKNGADYIGVGPVFATPTKEGRQPAGLEYVKWVSQNVSIPFFAIGGIDKENILQVKKSGASGIAVVRAIINSQNPQQCAKEFLDRL